MGRLWLPVHPSIPGAVWMPEAGAEPLAPAREALFYARVAALTGGDKAKPVVVFCHVECWGSWNAAKRLVLKGYTGVCWFPQGVEGWQEQHETANLTVDGKSYPGVGVSYRGNSSFQIRVTEPYHYICHFG